MHCLITVPAVFMSTYLFSTFLKAIKVNNWKPWHIKKKFQYPHHDPQIPHCIPWTFETVCWINFLWLLYRHGWTSKQNLVQTASVMTPHTHTKEVWEDSTWENRAGPLKLFQKWLERERKEAGGFSQWLGLGAGLKVHRCSQGLV